MHNTLIIYNYRLFIKNFLKKAFNCYKKKNLMIKEFDFKTTGLIYFKTPNCANY